MEDKFIHGGQSNLSGGIDGLDNITKRNAFDDGFGDRDAGKKGSKGEGKRSGGQNAVLPELNSVHRATVMSITDYGCFVQLDKRFDGKEFKHGLLHKSRMSTQKVETVTDMVSSGDNLFVKVCEVDLDAMKFSVDIRWVNQTTGRDMDAANENFERAKGKQGGGKKGDKGDGKGQKGPTNGGPSLDNVVNKVTCSKCGAVGHYAFDCLSATGDGKKFELINGGEDLFKSDVNSHSTKRGAKGTFNLPSNVKKDRSADVGGTSAKATDEKGGQFLTGGGHSWAKSGSGKGGGSGDNPNEISVGQTGSWMHIIYSEKWKRYTEARTEIDPISDKELFLELFGDEVFSYHEIDRSDKKKERGKRLIEKFGSEVFTNIAGEAKVLVKSVKKAAKREKKDMKKVKKKMKKERKKKDAKRRRKEKEKEKKKDKKRKRKDSSSDNSSNSSSDSDSDSDSDSGTTSESSSDDKKNKKKRKKT